MRKTLLLITTTMALTAWLLLGVQAQAQSFEQSLENFAYEQSRIDEMPDGVYKDRKQERLDEKLKRLYDQRDAAAGVDGSEAEGDRPGPQQTVLSGGVDRTRNVPGNTPDPGGYEAPGYILPGNVAVPGSTPGRVRGNARTTQVVPQARPPAPRPVASTRLCGNAAINFPDNTSFSMSYSLCLQADAVRVSTATPTPWIDAVLQGGAAENFRNGLPTIVQFRGFRNGANVFTTTEIRVRINGAVNNAVKQYRVNSRMTLSPQ